MKNTSLRYIITTMLMVLCSYVHAQKIIGTYYTYRVDFRKWNDEKEIYEYDASVTTVIPVIMQTGIISIGTKSKYYYNNTDHKRFNKEGSRVLELYCRDQENNFCSIDFEYEMPNVIMTIIYHNKAQITYRMRASE